MLFVRVSWVSSLLALRGDFPQLLKEPAAFRVLRVSPQVYLAHGFSGLGFLQRFLAAEPALHSQRGMQPRLISRSHDQQSYPYGEFQKRLRIREIAKLPFLLWRKAAEV